MFQTSHAFKKYCSPACKKGGKAERSGEWASRNSQRFRDLGWKSALKLKYGITPEIYDAILRSQDGRCAICKGISQHARLGVDHCHRTGKVRGLICVRCNSALGYLKESLRLFKSAVEYLERTDTQSDWRQHEKQPLASFSPAFNRRKTDNEA